MVRNQEVSCFPTCFFPPASEHYLSPGVACAHGPSDGQTRLLVAMAFGVGVMALWRRSLVGSHGESLAVQTNSGWWFGTFLPSGNLT